MIAPSRLRVAAFRRLAALALLSMLVAAVACEQRAAAPLNTTPRSSDWLALLPDGEEKRKFILDCTGCHALDQTMARTQGRPRVSEEWAEATERMLGYAGATTGFPVIAFDRTPGPTGAFAASPLAREPVAAPRPRGLRIVNGAVTEFEISAPRDLPHDVAVDAAGRVIVTGMFTHRMLVLDPASGAIDSLEIPVPGANPRAVEIDSTGAWWIVLGQPKSLARYSPDTKEWQVHPIGWYPHSLALAKNGAVWANAHFGRDPELILRMGASGAVDSFALPPHPTLAELPGGPIPYEVRVAPDGRVWVSELGGNRLIAFDPATGQSQAFDMPIPHMGPRRFDIDRDGVLWIPAFAANELVRFDPRTRAFERHVLPVADAVPYVARVDDATGVVWIGTSAADAVFAFEKSSRKFTCYELPSAGAMVRHLAIDPRNHEVWAAYGASPGLLSSRIARIRPAAR